MPMLENGDSDWALFSAYRDRIHRYILGMVRDSPTLPPNAVCESRPVALRWRRRPRGFVNRPCLYGRGHRQGQLSLTPSEYVLTCIGIILPWKWKVRTPSDLQICVERPCNSVAGRHGPTPF